MESYIAGTLCIPGGQHVDFYDSLEEFFYK